MSIMKLDHCLTDLRPAHEESRTSPGLLIVAPSAYLLSGLATWLDYLEPGLAAVGWHVTVGLVEGLRYHRPKQYLRIHPNRSWISIGCVTGTREGRYRAMQRAIRRLKPDLVATVNIPDAIAAVGRLRLERETAARVVMTCHGIEPELYGDMEQFVHVLDAVTCTNHLACRLAKKESGLPSDRILYAPYGVHQPEATVASKSHQDDPTSRPLRIAFAGRIEQDQKRVWDLPPILDGLAARGVAYRLLIAGTGPEEASLRQALAPQISQGCVQLLGHLGPEELSRRVYQESDVLLITSSWETGPIVAWEAMAHGVVVVSSHYVGSGSEDALCHEQTALLFPVGDTCAAGQQLARLAAEWPLRQRLIAEGRRLVKDRYSTTTSVRAWDEAFRAVMDRPPVPVTSEVMQFYNVPSGRCDAIFGTRMGETLRGLLRRRGPDGGPGGEWPHAWSRPGRSAKAFRSMAASLDGYNPSA